MSEVENFEPFTFTYDTQQDDGDLHLALRAIDRFRYSHMQLTESDLKVDGSPVKKLQLPLKKVVQLSRVNKGDDKKPIVLSDLCIDPRLN
jgi:hypothetical protein